MTKAQLQQRISELELALELDKKEIKRVNNERETLEDRLERLEELGTAWIANNSPGEPVCYVGTYADKGLNIDIYRDKDGDVLGVTVWDQYEFLSAAGLFPAAAYADEVRRP